MAISVDWPIFKNKDVSKALWDRDVNPQKDKGDVVFIFIISGDKSVFLLFCMQSNTETRVENRVWTSGTYQSRGGGWEEESVHRGWKGRIQKTVEQWDGVLR